MDELSARACAVVVVVPTGQESSKALPKGYGAEDSAPTVYTRMRVTKVLAGSLNEAFIDLVSPGLDIKTGRPALARGGPFLAFIAPAMYRRNDPAGGYVVVGGPAGVYGSQGSADRYLRIDTESPSLPIQIVVGETPIPTTLKSEKQLLDEGPL